MCNSISPQEFRERKLAADVVVLDVRTPREQKEEGFISENLIDFEAPGFEAELERLDPSNRYLLYCKTGIRSKRACQIMQNNGFFHVNDLDGGYSRWKAEFN